MITGEWTFENNHEGFIELFWKSRSRREELEPLSWHNFRRTFISDIIASKGLVVAQKMVGHSSSETTAKYDRLWKKQIEDVMAYRDFAYDFDVRQYQLIYTRQEKA